MTGPTAPPIAHGFLNIDKEAGETSTGVVRAVKRITGCRKVGHGGTLDPRAVGVLPICLGQATRFADAALLGTKAYTMTVRLGVATDTYDAAGETTVTCDASSVTRSQVAALLDRFRGPIQQVPPMYSAIKQRGKRLYQLAREGIEVERAPRPVQVHSLELVEWSPPDFVLDVECGRGFYARSLAHDIGIALDSAAHLAALVRHRSGPFRLEDAATLGVLDEAASRGEWRSLLFPVDSALQGLRAIVLDPLQAEQVRHGQLVSLGHLSSTPEDGEQARAYDRDGELVAIMACSASGSLWRPVKVIATS